MIIWEGTIWSVLWPIGKPVQPFVQWVVYHHFEQQPEKKLSLDSKEPSLTLSTTSLGSISRTIPRSQISSTAKKIWSNCFIIWRFSTFFRSIMLTVSYKQFKTLKVACQIKWPNMKVLSFWHFGQYSLRYAKAFRIPHLNWLLSNIWSRKSCLIWLLYSRIQKKLVFVWWADNVK